MSLFHVKINNKKFYTIIMIIVKFTVITNLEL